MAKGQTRVPSMPGVAPKKKSPGLRHEGNQRQSQPYQRKAGERREWAAKPQ